MRIMHIITRMIVGGAQENTLYNCMDLIRQHGDEVKLVTGPSLGAEGALLDQTETVGLHIELEPSLVRAIHPMHDIRANAAITQAIKKWKPDVVHTHSAKAGLIGRSAAWSQRVPCVVHTVHGAPFHAFQNRVSYWFFVRCEKWAARRCHRMISVADAMTELMVNAKVAPRDKFVTIYSGMNVEPFLHSNQWRQSMRDKLGFQTEDVVVGKIARLYRLKGHEYVIQAAKSICKRNPRLKFLFVGDGLLRSQLEAEIAAAGLRDRFVFAGLVPPEQVPSYVAAMDVLVHASLREGLARALPQALIAGKPAISFDIDGAKEVVLNGRTGYLIAPKDVSGLAHAIDILAQKDSLRVEMGATGQSLFTDRFRHESMTDRIREQYQSILGRRSA
jgi:glycosyltransferase involved in cell wall biosynthesis